MTDRETTRSGTESARTEAERDSWRQQLAAAEEEERRRLARELHDQLGQHLTALSLGLAELRRLLVAGESPEPRLSQLETLAELLTRDARHLALELRPPELDDVGLESALDTYLQQWRHRYGVVVDLQSVVSPAAPPVPTHVGTAVYRIAQEALTNVAKHARATAVNVMLDRRDGEVRLVVEDDGVGFDLAATESRARRERRLGLASMRERATLAGGTLEVESAPGRGTTLYAVMPTDRRVFSR
jgi:signal transduction histidine kinase